MSDTNSLDYVGYAAVEFVPASGTFYYIPLRADSQWIKPNALTPEFLAASQAFEPVNWVQGLSQPVLFGTKPNLHDLVFRGFSSPHARLRGRVGRSGVSKRLRSDRSDGANPDQRRVQQGPVPRIGR